MLLGEAAYPDTGGSQLSDTYSTLQTLLVSALQDIVVDTPKAADPTGTCRLKYDRIGAPPPAMWTQRPWPAATLRTVQHHATR
jgi:hypothetical protein